MSRVLYVISDLHVGGNYPSKNTPGNRGFRICTRMNALTAFVESISSPSSDAAPLSRTELVINGDFIDFLSEHRLVTDPFSGEKSLGWSPFVADEQEAADILRRIVERDLPFFAALREFLRRGHHLTVILGNHDIELSLPLVRKTLQELLGADMGHFTFVYDGEAYTVGNVLIEHGNRYDEWNIVSHDALRRLRSMQSRREKSVEAESTFEPPAGSYMVAMVVNRIKKDYPFIDLLKPETTAALPILLALAPEYRSHLSTIARLALRTLGHGVGADGVPLTKGDVVQQDTCCNQDNPLDVFLKQSMDASTLQKMHAILNVLPSGNDSHPDEGDVAIMPPLSTWAQLRLCAIGPPRCLHSREQLLRIALRAVAEDYSFDRTKELPRYLVPATRMIHRGFKAVVFGHTHLAKQIACDDGIYLNCGTWADLIQFPTGSLDSPEVPNGNTGLNEFVTDMAESRLAQHICFTPTYVRLDLDCRDQLVRAMLCDFHSEESDEKSSQARDR